MTITAPALIRKAKSFTFGATIRVDRDAPLVFFHPLPSLIEQDIQIDASVSRIIAEPSIRIPREKPVRIDVALARSKVAFVARSHQHKVVLLSDEVLRNIFGFATQHGLPTTALAISWTCQKWRSLSIILPQLWTRIEIGDRTREKLVELYLRRSQSLPLNVLIDCAVNLESGALEAAYSESSRWVTANIMVPTGGVAMLETYVQGNTAMLQELQLDFYDDDGSRAREVPTCLAFAEALNLTTLKFSRSLSSERVIIPWWRLDVVEFVESYNEPDLFSMEELTFVFLPTTMRVNSSPSTRYHIAQPRLFGHLSTFILNVWNSSIARQLDFLTLPDLKTLEFDFGDQLDEPSSSDFSLALEGLLQRSGLSEKLQRLKLGGNFTDGHLIAALHCCPRLEELILRETDVLGAYMITHDVMELLTLPTGILPMLRKIEFVWSPHSMGDGQEWAPPMIHSRLIRHIVEYEGGHSALLDDVGLGVRGGGELDAYLVRYATELKDVPGVRVWLV